jgi:uncharacterized protein (TIGR02646 family)
MRKIDKSKISVPSKLLTSTCITYINDSISSIGTHRYSTSVYRHISVLKELEKLYNSKCGFCESDPSAGSALQVEHYRPKDKLKNNPIPHLGYYWLGYEWTNLTYACAKCNRGKSSNFPLKSTGIRVFSHPVDFNGSPNYSRFLITDSDLVNEEPLIFNPEIKDPSLYFFFGESGRIFPKNNCEEAKETIKKCGLNRKPLVLARRAIKDQLLNKCMKWIVSINEGKITKEMFIVLVQDRLSDLIESYIVNKPYSIYSITVFRYFDHFIVDRFSSQADKDLLMEAYNSFRVEAARLLK